MENVTFLAFTEKIVDNYIEDEAHPTYEELKKNNTSAVNNGTEKWIVDKDSTMYDIKVSHKLNKTNLNDLSIVYECFSKHTYEENEKSLYYYAFGDFTCNYLDEESSFILETDTKVIDSNATKKEGNKYGYLDRFYRHASGRTCGI